MQIDQRFVLPLPPEAAWPAFRDVALLVECLPGASLAGPAVDGELPLRFDVKLGPIAAGFVGNGKATFDDAARSGVFEGAASDRRTHSRVKGAARFLMSADGSGSLVTVEVDYALSGSLAQFGRAGIVRELASALTAQFASNLAARLVADAAAAAPAGMALERPVATEGPALRPAVGATGTHATAPLSAGSLWWQVLRARWSRLIEHITRRRKR